MTNKQYAFFGILAFVVFWCTYAVMSSLRPEYSAFTKAISELGSVDASNKWTWNIIGYMLPGIFISVFVYGLFKSMTQPESRLPLIAFVSSGLFMSFSGIFPGDFDNKQSATMLLHTLGSFGSYICFLLGAFTFPRLMRKSEYWKPAVIPTLTFTWLTILFGAWPFIFPTIPALGQRIVFFFYFLWIFYTAIRLYKMNDKTV